MTFDFAPLKPRSFDLVMIDPAWPWATWSEKGKAKSPDSQYETQTWDEIYGLPVADLLHDGGAVIVWCTWPLFGKQHMIVENVWGLRVQTGGAWSKRTKNGKLRWGTGHVMRSVCEPFIIATKGKNKLRGRSIKNLIESSEGVEIEGLAREHSRKPDEVYKHFENLTPGWRRADIYSRQRRAGWTGFGKELDKFPAIA
jgi:N6-adenosine-specific RNA methylase IME4